MTTTIDPDVAATCAEEGCDSHIYARGLCSADYQRRKRAGTLPPIPCPVPDCVNESPYKQRPCQKHLAEFTSAGMKWCSNPACGMPIKAVSEFHRNRSADDGLAGWCKACIKNYGTKNSGKISTRSAKRRKANPGFQHRLTAERYWDMWTRQDGKCAICTQKMDRDDSEQAYPCVDHDHAHCSGARGCPECVRSLLCSGCNLMLAQAHDDLAIPHRWKPTQRRPRWLIDAAIAYLEHWHTEMTQRGIRPSLEETLWQDVFGAVARLITQIA